ncbi:MAG: hypothetical protein IKA71_03680 [Lentisphaeria bacterium]|nr:hypothetical protein [Lentisphaeria bacterium]
MKCFNTLMFSICLLLAGCVCGQNESNTQSEKPADSPVEKNIKKTPVPAATLPAPVPKTPPVQPAPLPKTVQKIQPAPIKPEKTVLQKSVPPRRNRPPEKFRNGAGLWRAFSRLDQKEQQALLKIQRQNPEEFRKIMQEKVEALYIQEQARRQELDKLVIKYQNAKSDSEKASIKAELKQKLQRDFDQRLQNSRRDLDTNRARLLKMEKELQKREQNREAIVEAMTTKCLSGNKVKK